MLLQNFTRKRIGVLIAGKLQQKTLAQTARADARGLAFVEHFEGFCRVFGGYAVVCAQIVENVGREKSARVEVLDKRFERPRDAFAFGVYAPLVYENLAEPHGVGLRIQREVALRLLCGVVGIGGSFGGRVAVEIVVEVAAAAFADGLRLFGVVGLVDLQKRVRIEFVRQIFLKFQRRFLQDFQTAFLRRG